MYISKSDLRVFDVKEEVFVVNKFGKSLAAVALMSSVFCSNAMALLLDFTDFSTTSTGTIDGVGFTLMPSTGTLNLSERYDGILGAGCGVDVSELACERDGVGINNDEISGLSTSMGQILTVLFDEEVFISSVFLLDLYKSNRGTERARISVDAATAVTVDATESSGQGGFAEAVINSVGTRIEFTAFKGLSIQDDRSNDFAFAAIGVSAIDKGPDGTSNIPSPATLLLLGGGLIGMNVAFRRRRKFS